jgi:hypothetical protein
VNSRARNRLGRAIGWPLRTLAIGLFAAVALTQLGQTCGAHASGEMLAAGAEMLQVPHTSGTAAGGRVFLNGAELRIERDRTAAAVDAILDQAEAACAGSVLRDGDPQRGFVSCTDAGEGLSLPISYVYAERRGQDTQFIRVRSPRRIDLRALFPGDVDAPGRDPIAFPRRDGSRRIFTYSLSTDSQATAIYRDDARFEDVVAFYRAALPRAGWKVLAPWDAQEGTLRQTSVAVTRDGARALVLIAQDRPDFTTTTFMNLGGEL